MSHTTDNKWAWYLLPYFLSIIGGAIAYFALKDKDRNLARGCMMVGLVSLAPTAALFAIGFGIGLGL